MENNNKLLNKNEEEIEQFLYLFCKNIKKYCPNVIENLDKKKFLFDLYMCYKLYKKDNREQQIIDIKEWDYIVNNIGCRASNVFYDNNSSKILFLQDNMLWNLNELIINKEIISEYFDSIIRYLKLIKKEDCNKFHNLTTIYKAWSVNLCEDSLIATDGKILDFKHDVKYIENKEYHEDGWGVESVEREEIYQYNYSFVLENASYLWMYLSRKNGFIKKTLFNFEDFNKLIKLNLLPQSLIEESPIYYKGLRNSKIKIYKKEL